jgi:very-short-patch-repair endonuclease
MGEAMRNVIEFAQTNGGLVTRAEAIAMGMAPRTLRRRVVDGVLIELRPGVYALPGATDPHVLVLHMACRKLGAIVSHQSAAYLHGLARPGHIKPTVSVPRNTTKDLAGVRVHQTTDIGDDQVQVINGLAVTCPERTLIDLAAVYTDKALGRILDHGLAAKIVDYRRLTDLFAAIGRRGKPGTARLRRLIDARGVSFIPADTELERRLLDVLLRAGLPHPELQFKAPWLKAVNGRVDMAYVEARLIIEGDSRRWHQLVEAFETDRLRDNAAQLAGWRVLRFTWLEITQNPERVARTLAHALQPERI